MTQANKWQRHGGSDFLPAFRFTEVDQAIEGKFLRIKNVKSDVFQSGEAKFVEINVTSDPNGKALGEASLMGHGLLVWLLEDAKVKEGDEIRIVYKGKEKYKDGKKSLTSNVYELFVNK